LGFYRGISKSALTSEWRFIVEEHQETVLHSIDFEEAKREERKERER
jgi:predicted Ser/Thr protein kinase